MTGALRVLEEQTPPVRTQAQQIRYLMGELESQRAALELQNQQFQHSRAALEESRARYADLYDFAPVAYLRLDRTGKIVEANLTAATLFRTERGRLIGRSLSALSPPDARPALLAHLRVCFSEAIRATSEIAVGSRGSGPLAVQITSTPLLGPDGGVIGCKSMLTDVSELKRAEEVLRFLGEASATLASSFDYESTVSETIERAAPLLADIVMVDIVDRDQELRRIQIAAADSRHYRLARIARSVRPAHGSGTPIGRVLEMRQPLLLVDCHARIFRDGGDGFTHEAFVRACLPRSLMYVPILAHGNVLGVLTFMMAGSARRFGPSELASATDLASRIGVTIENARLYEDATNAIKAREQVLSFVSHDLKNPLMGILLSTELLLNRAPADERRRGWKQLDRIRRGVLQMRHMVEDLLDASGIDAGHLAVELGDHRAGEVLDDALELLRPIAEAKSIHLKADLRAPALAVHCDRSRVVQVLFNLIGNAIKFTPPAGEVMLTCERLGDDALVTIQDSGRGVPRDLFPHLFQRYVQSHSTARQGLGLGLFISRGIIEAHGGRIWADPLAEHGARFQFTIPLASPVQVASLTGEMPASEATGTPPSVAAGSE